MSAPGPATRPAGRRGRIIPPWSVAPPLLAPPAPPTTLRGRLKAFAAWMVHPHPVVLETMRSVEVPPITETKRRWVSGDRAGAVAYAWGAALYDVQRAFNVRFPPHWTNEDILVLGVTPEMVPIPEFLEKLLREYEPIRYGGLLPAELPSPEPILQSIYAHRAMWLLYVEAMSAPPALAASLSPAGGPEAAS
jgi:hypothetical protein